jgi:N-acyl-D-amino-acid deacylase
MSRAGRLIALTLIAAAVLGAVVQAQPDVRYAILLRNGMLLDGTGAPAYRADVGIVGGAIARIGDLSGERGALELDVAGLLVAPGFINLHSHSALDGLPRAENLLTQGVTTVLLNSDGRGPADLAYQIERLGWRGLAVNAGPYIGFNGVWESVVGQHDRRPTAEELDRMRGLIVRGLESGAWGVSAGLEYAPGYYARMDEVIRVVEAAARWRTNFPNHERVTPESGFSAEAGIIETLAIAQATGLTAVVTHLKLEAALERMDRATSGGYYTAADVYPYLAGQGRLGALLIPRWAQQGGRGEMLRRFADPPVRARIVTETEQALTTIFTGPENIYLSSSRRELVDVMREHGVSAGEAVVRVLEQADAIAILRFGVEENLVRILRHPTASIACDCDATTSPLAHPRYYGTFPRVLGRYVREQMVLTWEDAIRKMTGLPASTIGLVDRGFLAVGMAADVTVFDPATIIDRATYEEPARLSEGVRHVLVNGRGALRDGRVTGEQGGRALRRTIHMPSRPMGIAGTRRVSARPGTMTVPDPGARAASYRVELDVRQPAGAHRAEGSFRLVDAGARTVLQSTDLGILQITNRWASFTGRARFAKAGEQRPFTVIVEQSDPRAPERASVIVSADGLSVRGLVAPERLEIVAPSAP